MDEENDEKEEDIAEPRINISRASSTSDIRLRKQVINGIINSANGIEMLRCKSSKLQGQVSGKMKKLIIDIKRAAECLMRIEEEDNVPLKKRDHYCETEKEVVQLRIEKERLESQVRLLSTKVNEVPNNKGIPRLKDISRVPPEDEERVNHMINKLRSRRKTNTQINERAEDKCGDRMLNENIGYDKQNERTGYNTPEALECNIQNITDHITKKVLNIRCQVARVIK